MAGRARDSMATTAHALFSYAAAASIAGGVTFDAAGLAAGLTLCLVLGAHLISAGVVLALPAALAGLLAHAELPPTRARRRSVMHAILGLAPVVLLALARWVRGHPEVRPDPPIFAAEVLAALLIVLGVWLGRRIGREQGLRRGLGGVNSARMLRH